MRVLLIEDNPRDAELALVALKNMPDLEFDHVDGFEKFKLAYTPGKYAAIISDNNLGDSSGIEIFNFIQEVESGIPFILISGALGEERAVEILRLGVTDYVLKDKLSKLPLVLSRSLKEAESQKAEKRGLQNLRQSEEKFRKIFESISDVYYQTDTKGMYTLLSPSCFEITGYHPDELVGKSTSILYQNSAVEKVLLGNLKKGIRLNNFEITIIGKDGRQILVSANIILIVDEKGQPAGTQGIYRDITEKKKQDEELILAQSASLTKSQFLANMSHEIRTPLNAVIGLSHLALKTDLTSKQADYLTKIKSSSESLLGIINDILDFSKIEAGKLALEEVPFDLEEVFQKLADVITYKAYGKGLEIAFGITSNVPTHLIGDPIRLEQILSNLCSNAVKFTDVGEVVVRAGVAKEEGDEVTLQFEVADTGIGMNKTQTNKLFQPFTQADDSISRKYGGTGLGLSIIKRLVDLMGGKVWVKSEPGEGSKFYFTVQMKKQIQQRKTPVLSIDVRKIRILLVDDNKSAQKILKEALESLSFEVVTCDSGIDAVHFLKNNNHYQPIKVVLMDWNVPGMNGLEAAEMIRQDKELQDVRVIMTCTSYASDELYQKTEELGLSGILIKPIRYSSLYDAIINAIDNGVLKNHKTKRKEQPHEQILEHWGHLLLAEDNEINQQVARELLEGFGFKVDIVNNGLEAVNEIRKSPKDSPYDLVLMDLQMPIMGGYKATEEIMKLTSHTKLPIIAMTADAMSGVKEKCLEAGMVDFITKPINPDQLLAMLQKWVKAPDKKHVQNTTKSGKEGIIIPLMTGINLKTGLGHLGENSLLYHDLLIKFMDKYGDFVAILKKEFASGMNEDGMRLIHTLKGMAGHLGMISLHDLCETLEKKIQNDPGNTPDEIFDPISEEFRIVLESLNKNMVRRFTPTPKLSFPEVLNLLTSLKKLLQDQDPDALIVLKKVGTVTGYEHEMGLLSKAMQKYDFDTALAILDKIRIFNNDTVNSPIGN